MAKEMEAFVEEFRRMLTEERPYSWGTLDHHLLTACASGPAHDDVHAVFAKVALVNRVYRTNLRFGGRDAEWRIAEAMVAARLDEELRQLHGVADFDAVSVSAVVRAHQRLLSIIWGVTERTEVSFASKYLHFHYPPLFPIYDSYAVKAARRVLPAPLAARPAHADLWSRKYEDYCFRILDLKDALRTAGVPSPTVKHIDIVLYWRMRREAPRPSAA